MKKQASAAICTVLLAAGFGLGTAAPASAAAPQDGTFCITPTHDGFHITDVPGWPTYGSVGVSFSGCANQDPQYWTTTITEQGVGFAGSATQKQVKATMDNGPVTANSHEWDMRIIFSQCIPPIDIFPGACGAELDEWDVHFVISRPAPGQLVRNFTIDEDTPWYDMKGYYRLHWD